MVDGVSKGFPRVLEINGVGYRAEARGNILYMTLGDSCTPSPISCPRV